MGERFLTCKFPREREREKGTLSPSPVVTEMFGEPNRNEVPAEPGQVAQVVKWDDGDAWTRLAGWM